MQCGDAEMEMQRSDVPCRGGSERSGRYSLWVNVVQRDSRVGTPRQVQPQVQGRSRAGPGQGRSRASPGSGPQVQGRTGSLVVSVQGPRCQGGRRFRVRELLVPEGSGFSVVRDAIVPASRSDLRSSRLRAAQVRVHIQDPRDHGQMDC